MKYVLLAISALAMAILACSPAVTATPVPTKLPTETEQIANIATTTPMPTDRPDVCAEVAAGGYLHLRGDRSEEARVIDWLPDGEILTVIASYGDGWMLVEHDGVLGYVRAIYTKEAKCK